MQRFLTYRGLYKIFLEKWAEHQILKYIFHRIILGLATTRYILSLMAVFKEKKNLWYFPLTSWMELLPPGEKHDIFQQGRWLLKLKVKYSTFYFPMQI